MTAATMTAAACIRSRHALNAPILRFLLTAAKDFPDGNRTGLPGVNESTDARLSSFLLSSPRSLARMTRRLSESAGESWPAMFLKADFSSLPARLLLLPGEHMRDLALYAGLVLHCRALAAIVVRKDVHALRAAFGDAAHQFAVLRAPFFLRNPDRLARALTGPYPEQPGIEELILRVHRAGFSCLSACAAFLPPALETLFGLKLAALSSRGAEHVPAAFALEEDAAYSLHALLEKLVRKELDPLWNPSCS